MLRVVLLAMLCLGMAVRHASAQERYLLQLGPRTGDTLHLEFDQRTEVAGTPTGGSTSAARTTMGMHVWSRVIAEGRINGATSVVAATDSAMAVASDARSGTAGLPRRAMVVGQLTRFHVAPDGSLRVPDIGTADGRELAQTMSLVPATLPSRPVAVGEQWSREMPVPMGGPGAEPRSIHAVFRLDSVARRGELAYLSMRGQLDQDSVPAGPPRGSMMAVGGTVTGALVLDRHRGWLTKSQFLMVLRSTLVPPPGANVAPLQFVTRITQRMWVTDGARRGKSR